MGHIEEELSRRLMFAVKLLRVQFAATYAARMAEIDALFMSLEVDIIRKNGGKMTEPIQNSQTIDNIKLRFLVRDAAEREVKIALALVLQELATLRQEVQIARGMAQQNGKDAVQLSMRIDDIDEMLTGNQQKGIKGLVATVGDLKKTLDEFNHSVRTGKYLLGALIALGVFDAFGITEWFRQLIGVLPSGN